MGFLLSGTNMTTKFTPQQLLDYADYEAVRSGGHYNMFDPRARQLTGLSKADYAFVINNFEALEAQYEAAEDAHILEQIEIHQTY